MTSLFSQKHLFYPYRVALLLSIIPIFIAGLTCEFYTGPGRKWFNDSGGDFLYQIFLILLISFIGPKLSLRWTAFGVFVFNCTIEFLQLWKPPFLEPIRHTLFGRLFIGYNFSWEDIFYYAMGCFLGWVWVRAIQHKILRSQISSNYTNGKIE